MSEKKSSSSMKVKVQAEKKSTKTPTRKRPSVSNRSISVSIGGAKGKKKLPSPSAKKTPASKARTVRKSPPSSLDMGMPALLLPFMLAMFVLFLTIVMMRPTVIKEPKESHPILIVIEPGMSATAVSLLLAERNVVTDSSSLLAFFVEEGITATLQSGSFVMSEAMSYQEIAQLLSPSGHMTKLTVGPGFTIDRVDALLAQRMEEESGSFIEACDRLVQAHHLGFAEGWLLGGTYDVSGAEDLAQQMHEAMVQAVHANLHSPLLSTYSVEQLLIIATLIQAETQNIAEMAGISAVIHNRLVIDEPLGIDATTRYELNDWVSEIPTSALEAHTPYNTRRKRGLPPTGICAPSEAAVRAAFFPEQRGELFYLHGLDKQIHFAYTYDEHRENIRRYR